MAGMRHLVGTVCVSDPTHVLTADREFVPFQIFPSHTRYLWVKGAHVFYNYLLVLHTNWVLHLLDPHCNDVKA